MLKLFLDQARLGRVFAAPTDVVLSEVDVVEPDILCVSKERAERLEGVPELAQEAGHALTSPLLPGFTMPLAKIFE